MRLKILGFVFVSIVLVIIVVMVEDVILIIESWWIDDLIFWQDKIILVFEKDNLGIKVVFLLIVLIEYNVVFNFKLEVGSVGDLIICCLFDVLFVFYDVGYFVDLDDMVVMLNFFDVVKFVWQMDDVFVFFCVLMVFVIYGFIYNKDVFNELGFEVLVIEVEFFVVFDKIKEDGIYILMVMGINDQWEVVIMGYNNIGLNYWKGEEGCFVFINGEQKLIDEVWVVFYVMLVKWGVYFGDGYEVQIYLDSQNLFIFGCVVIYLVGSWEIVGFNVQVDFEMGVFKLLVQVVGDICYIFDYMDIGIGLNVVSENVDVVKIFLVWVVSLEFVMIFGNVLLGFFLLFKMLVELEDLFVKEFVGWCGECEFIICLIYQILLCGMLNLENDIWGVSVVVIKGIEILEVLGVSFQEGFVSWYVLYQ